MGNDIKKVDNDVSLDTPIEELEQKLLAEKDIDKLNQIINIFNLSIKRKDIVRNSKLNDLQDKITNQMEDRLSNRAGEFSNKDLLEYYKVIQDTITKADNSLNNIDTPAIQINQQNINIDVDKHELSRESKERVKDVLAMILSQAQTDSDNEYIIEDVEIEEKIED